MMCWETDAREAETIDFDLECVWRLDWQTEQVGGRSLERT